MEVRTRKSIFEPQMIGSPKRGLFSQRFNEEMFNQIIPRKYEDQFLKKQALPSPENPSSPKFCRSGPNRGPLKSHNESCPQSSIFSDQFSQSARPITNQIGEIQNQRASISSWRTMIDTFNDVVKENYPLLNFLKNLDPSGVQILGQFEQSNFREELQQCLRKQTRSNINHIMRKIEKFFEKGKDKKFEFESNSKKFLDIFNDYEDSDDEEPSYNNNILLTCEKEIYSMASESLCLVNFQRIIFETKLGEGAYSEVFLCIYEDKKYAIKRMKETDDKRVQYSRLQRELTALKRIQNVPNTVQIKGFCIRPYCCLLLEVIEGGSLDQIFSYNRYSFQEKIEISVKLANTVQTLHTMDPPLIHRDISLQNVMISHKEDGIVPILGDFGISTVKSKIYESPSNLIGHPRYRPPEITLKKSCSKKVDVYCYGSFLCELFSGMKVGDGMSDGDICRMRVQNEDITIPNNVHPEITNLIRRCWTLNPKERPNFSDIVQNLENISTTVCCPSSSAH